jgi:aminoglycoside 6'-N-acetyltransferase
VSRGPVLVGEGLVLRPATESDIPTISAILATPEVSRWWGTPLQADELARDFLAEDAVAFAIEVDGKVVGWLQYAEESDRDYRSAGLDISLHPDYIGRGLGANSLRTMARYLFEERGHHRLTIDPAADNERAIACYRKVGFQPVGILRQYERGADGTWHDGLLMDLLSEEFS